MVHAPDFDLSNENVALIRMSGEPSSLGTIVDANMSALKMLGYARRDECLQAIKRVRDAGTSPLLYDNFGPIASVSGAMVA